MNKESWYRPVLIFYGKVTSWIIVPILLGIIANRYLGLKILITISLGFIISCFGIYKEIKKYQKSLEDGK